MDKGANEMKNDVLLIEDTVNIAKILKYDLEQSGFSTTVFYDGNSAMQAINTIEYSVYILDWMLPDVTGIELCKLIRKNFPAVHIIMLTARSEELDKIEAFNEGADDYITKPFSSRELIARIKAYLRKKQLSLSKEEITKIQYEDLTVFTDKIEIWCNSQQLTLTKKEYELLLYFINHPQKVITRDKLLDRIWGYDYDGENRTVDVHVFKVRNKLEKHSALRIETIRGMGYILTSDTTKKSDTRE